jgi:type I restriction enzyme, S subunit
MENSTTKPFYNTIPSDWEVKRLGEICSTFKSGYGITSEDINENDDFAVYGGNGLRGYTNRYTHEGNYFLIGRQGALCGNIVRVSGKNYISEHAIAVQADTKHDNLFLAYKLEFQNLNRLSESSAQPGLSVEKLVRLKITLPPLPEQRAIAHVLGLMDSAINQNNQLLAQKELRKKWLMQNLLTGKKRLIGFGGAWKEIHIKDVAKEVSIKNKDNKQLTVLSCTKYDGLVESLEYWGRKIFADDISTYKIVPKNHFAYATNHIEEGSIGYQDTFDEALISPMYTVFKTNSSINDLYFYKLLKSHMLVYQYQNRMEGSIDRRGGLRWDAFSIIKIHIPSYEEQTAITQVLETADKEIQLLKAKTNKLREQKKGMMQVLLMGKKRLNLINT